MPALGLDQALEPHRLGLGACAAEQPREGGVGRADEALRIDRGDGDRGGMEQAGKSELRRADFLRLPPPAGEHERMSERA